MEKYIDFMWLALLGAGIIAVTRFLLIRGIVLASTHWRLRKKVQGQILGYATSTPELVGTVATAAKGLLGAGLWNVVASNVINVLLFLSASMVYRRTAELKQRKFFDEIGFSLGTIVLPTLLVLNSQWAKSPWVALLLFGFFLVYLWVDKKLNPQEEEESAPPVEDGNQGWVGIGLIMAGIVGITLLGNYLGVVAEQIVVQLQIPEAAIGWVLGVITSLPELTSFYAVFAAAQATDGDEHSQQNLDNLAASNMSNTGLIYPLGIVIFVLVT